MSKKKQKPINRPVVLTSTAKNQVQSKDNKTKNILYIIIAIAVTALVYAVSVFNGWAKNWDDGGYVLDSTNPIGALVHKLSWENIKAVFSVFYKGNYHPLTTLVYAIEYSVAGDKPMLYHFVNLVFHLLNVFLAYKIVKILSRKSEIAFITALFFGIHPMHVESVAWISELKDVMYGFFFLGAMILYSDYFLKKEKKTLNYLLALLAFILSCLSKSAAVTLPVILLLTDYYLKRKFHIRIIIEKIPFFIVAIVFGILAILSQDKAGAIQDLTPLFTWFERPMLASYATLTYLVKFIAPTDLSAMYPYPDRVGGYLPLIYFIAPLIIIILGILVYHSRKFSRDIIFGTFFFLITISLVLQILPVGGAIVAERYTYIPYIGLFLITGKGYVYSQEGKGKFAGAIKRVFPAILIIGAIIFSVLTFQRIKIWKDGEALFTDLIKKYPNLPFAYNNRGYLYFNFIKNYDKAIADYNKCIELDSTFHRAYSNRGVLYYNIYGPSKSDSLHLELARKDFTKALRFKSDNTDALIGRANTLSTQNKFRESLPDYNKYIPLVPDDAKAYMWRGIAYYQLDKSDSALADMNKSIEMMPGNAMAFQWRGIVYLQKKNYTAATADFEQSLKLNPGQSSSYNWRGLAKFHQKMYNEAIADYNIAISKDPKDPTAFINRSSAYYELKNYEQSFKDYCSAGDLRYALNKEYFFKLKALAGK